MGLIEPSQSDTKPTPSALTALLKRRKQRSPASGKDNIDVAWRDRVGRFRPRNGCPRFVGQESALDWITVAERRNHAR
jgi:hypothetical protein